MKGEPEPKTGVGFVGGYTDGHGDVHGGERALYAEWLAGPGADLDDDNSTSLQRMAAFDRWEEDRA